MVIGAGEGTEVEVEGGGVGEGILVAEDAADITITTTTIEEGVAEAGGTMTMTGGEGVAEAGGTMTTTDHQAIRAEATRAVATTKAAITREDTSREDTRAVVITGAEGSNSRMVDLVEASPAREHGTIQVQQLYRAVIIQRNRGCLQPLVSLWCEPNWLAFHAGWLHTCRAKTAAAGQHQPASEPHASQNDPGAHRGHHRHGV